MATNKKEKTTNKKEKTMEDIYGPQRAKYITRLGQAMDMGAQREREAAAQQRTQLTLSDLEAYYRGLLEDSLYNRNSVYTNPDMTPEERAQIEQAGADDFNRFLNAYLLILQEQGIDVNDPSAYLDATQREINGLKQQIRTLESGTRNAQQQTQYESLLQQLEDAQARYSKAEGIWQYTDAGRANGWTPGTVGESGADFDAIAESAQGRQEMLARMEEGFGSGGALSGLWQDPAAQERKITWEGGEYNGVYVQPGTYTQAQWEEAITSPYARIGEDDLTDGQRLMQMNRNARERSEAQKLASLVSENGVQYARNNTPDWTSEDVPNVDTTVANGNTSGITMTDAGRDYLAELAAKNEQETASGNDGSALANLLQRDEDADGTASGTGSGTSTGYVGTGYDYAKIQNEAYRGMLDAMARGAARTGGYANTAALQAANEVHDAYKESVPGLNLAQAYDRYLRESGNRAGASAYRWLNRNQSGGYGTSAPTPAPATKPVQSVQTAPTVSGGTPVSGTPVRVTQPSGIGTGHASAHLANGYPAGTVLRQPNVMQAQQEQIRQYLTSLLKR